MRGRRPLRAATAEARAGAPAWAVTYGDLVTQVLAFFVLLYSISSLNETRFRQTLDALQPIFGTLPAPEVPSLAATRSLDPAGDLMAPLQARLQERAAQAGAEAGFRFELTAAGLVIHLDAALLFASGSAAIRPEAVPMLDAMGPVLAGVANQIRIEGHTDSDPMVPNPYLPDNWMLSGARAASLLRYLHDYHGIAHTRMAIAGYGETRPVATNLTPEGKARNRRVEILLVRP